MRTSMMIPAENALTMRVSSMIIPADNALTMSVEETMRLHECRGDNVLT